MFHSQTEADRMIAAVRLGSERVRIAAHGASFVRRTALSREDARHTLGLPEGAHVFLAIGFIQRHKGFDRAVRAFSGLANYGAQLHIVGSTRLDEPEFVEYLNELERLVAQTAGAILHDGYVSDELFDRWLLAADTVVLPYREIWSSGVLERAAIYDKAAIATRVGGLDHQSQGRAVRFVDDDADLRAAMWEATPGAGAPNAQADRHLDWPKPGAGLWLDAQRAVRAVADMHRPNSPLAQIVEPGHGSAGVDGPAASSASLPLRRLGGYVAPPPVSARPGVGPVKRVVNRLTLWQINALASYIGRLQTATAQSIDAVSARLDALDGGTTVNELGNPTGTRDSA
jgi:hypothetical protein